MTNERRYVLNGMLYETINCVLQYMYKVFCSNRMNSPCGQAPCHVALDISYQSNLRLFCENWFLNPLELIICKIREVDSAVACVSLGTLLRWAMWPIVFFLLS